MRLGMSQVEKKGIAAVPVDKINGVFSKPGGKVRLMCRGDRINFYLSISPEVQRKLPPELRILRMLCPHVVGIHDTDGLVKSTVMRACLIVIAQVPFTKKSCCIPCTLKHLPQRHKLRIQSTLAGCMGSEKSVTLRISPRHQCASCSGTDGLGNLETGKGPSFFR